MGRRSREDIGEEGIGIAQHPRLFREVIGRESGIRSELGGGNNILAGARPPPPSPLGAALARFGGAHHLS